MMLLAAAMLAAAPPATPARPVPYPKADLAACAGTDDAAAITCRALNAERGRRFGESAAEFERLAAKVERDDPVKRDRAWSAAGNMWIAAGRMKEAAAAIDKSLAGQTLQGTQLGMTQLDRARVAEAQGDLKTARTMVRAAAVTTHADPFLWYFSARLSVRENDLPGARSAINKALAMAPESAEVMVEAGRIADRSGDDAAARDLYARAAAADPRGPAGRAARNALGEKGIPLTVTNQVAARPDGDGEGQDKAE